MLSPNAMNFVNFSRRSGSDTATLKLQLLWPTVSTAVQTTAFEPTGNSESGSGEHLTVTGGCSVVDEGRAKCTGCGTPESRRDRDIAGQAMVGPLGGGGGVVPAGDSQPPETGLRQRGGQALNACVAPVVRRPWGSVESRVTRPPRDRR